MINIRLLMTSMLIAGGALSAEEFSRQETPFLSETFVEEKNQQVFLFGGVDALGAYNNVTEGKKVIPEVGVMYRTKHGKQGYDIAANTFGFGNGAEVSATYNLYAPVEFVQPYIGVGGGVAGTYNGQRIMGVIPVLVGVNSEILFLDAGIATYLGKSESPKYPWLVGFKPQVRLGAGFQF